MNDAARRERCTGAPASTTKAPSGSSSLRTGLVVVLCVAPMLSSCFTTAVWSLDRKQRTEIRRHALDEAIEDDDERDDLWKLELLGRLLLTPFAVVLDVLTAPYQCLVRDDDPVDAEPRTNYRMTSR